MSEEIKNQKNAKKEKKNNTENRFADVIEKMEEETKKTEKKKKTKKTEENEKEQALVKTTKNNLPIENQKELEAVEEEIKAETKISKEKINKIHKKIFKNILFAIVILIYFILINMGYTSIKSDVFITDLKVFSITCIVATICVFEYAYKKESGKYGVNGIELLILSIATLLCIRIYTIYNNKFVSLVTSIALLFAIYYVGKSIVEYVKYKRKLNKQTTNVYKTAKK